MSIRESQHPEHRLTLWHDLEAQPEPTEYTVFLHGKDFTVAAREGEDSRQTWERVLAAIHNERLAISRSKSVLNPLAPATVYAGELEPSSLEKLRRRHMREFILARAHEESNDMRNGTGQSRTAALALLAKMTGVARRK